MNPVLVEIYSTVLPAAPFVIAAYAGILLALGIYVFYVTKKLRDTEKKLAALEEHVMRDDKAYDVATFSDRDIFKEN